MKLIRTLDELQDSLEVLDKAPVLYVDTETTGLDPYTMQLLLLQIADETEVYVYDYTTLPVESVSLFSRILSESPSIKVLHNATFDLKVLWQFGRFLVNKVHDTLVTESLLTAGKNERVSLQATVKRRLDEDIDKTVRDQFTNGFSGLTEAQIAYAAADVEYLRRLYPIHLQLIADNELQRVYSLEMSLVRVVAMMEYYGMPLNEEHLAQLEPVLQDVIERADLTIQSLVLEAGLAECVLVSKDGLRVINTSSTKQMLRVFNGLGIDVDSLSARTLTEWDFKNRKSAADYRLEELVSDSDLLDSVDAFGRYENQMLRLYAYLVGARKLQSTYILGLQQMQNPVTKRVHCTFKQVGAATGRFSSSSPNLQNIPSDQKMKSLNINSSIRHAFQVAKENRRLIIADYSTIELVIIADASGDEGLISNLEDLHTYVAHHVLGVKDITNENKKQHPYKIWRDVAKMVNYSIAYSVGAESLAKQMTIQLGPLGVKIAPAKADAIIHNWHQLFPEATKWLEQSSRSVIVRGFVADSYGRRRWWDTSMFYKPWLRAAAEREGANFPIQALSATMVKLALVKTFERLNQKRAVIVSTVHDEIILESTELYAEEACGILKQAMEEAAQEVLPRLGHSVIVDPAISMRYDK